MVDKLIAQEDPDRKGLAAVTMELQIISKDVNKLVSDFDVAMRGLVKMQEALTRLDTLCTPPSTLSWTGGQQLRDTLQYLCSSMDKLKMWLSKDRDRNDIAMSLVSNLVMQRDAAANIEIAKDMKLDSASMNGIAWMTMLFLPGTFTMVSTPSLLPSVLAAAPSLMLFCGPLKTFFGFLTDNTEQIGSELFVSWIVLRLY